MGKGIQVTKFCHAAIPHAVFSLLLLVSAAPVNAGGGVALKDDQCIIKIEFYSAHFTAYQPESSGDQQYCENLPETGTTIFVLDYLHRSLKGVPVDFRIIRNVTELGAYARLADVQALGDLDVHTVYYRPPIVERTGSYKAEVQFSEPGEYIGVVSAGHPSNDKIYFAVFPFSVGASSMPLWLFYIAAGVIAAGVVSFRFRNRGVRARDVASEPG